MFASDMSRCRSFHTLEGVTTQSPSSEPAWQADERYLDSFPEGLQALVVALACPIDWNRTFLNAQPTTSSLGPHDAFSLALWLNRKWAHLLSDYAADQGWSDALDEVLDISNFDTTPGGFDASPRYRGVSLEDVAIVASDDGDDLRDLERAVSALAPLLPSCRDGYLHRSDIRFWIELKIAGRDIYPKHYVKTKAMSRTEIVMATREEGSSSLLYPECEPLLSTLMWRILEELAESDRWDYLDSLPTRTTRVYLSLLGESIGAAGGVSTDLACFEVSGSARLIHVYPVQKHEVGHPPAYIDDLDVDTSPPLICVDDFQGTSSAHN